MTPQAIENLALHRAAEAVRNGGDSFSVQGFLRAQIASEILALAPMTPLQAALEVPEVKALVEAAMAVRNGVEVPAFVSIGDPAPQHEHRHSVTVSRVLFGRFTAALAALEERT